MNRKYSLFSMMFPIAYRLMEGAGEGAPGGAPAGGEGAPPPPAAPAAPWSGAEGMWQIGEGDGAQPWYATIPEGPARAHIEAKQYANPAELALANYSLTRLQTGDPNVVALPGPDATPEQQAEFYSKLGRPESADKYEFKFGDDVQVDDKMVEFGKTVAFDLGLNPTQAQQMADKWNAFAAEIAQNAPPADATFDNDAELAQLGETWGANLDQMKAAGQRAVQQLGLSQTDMDRIESAIGAAPLVNLLAKIGSKSSEAGAPTAGAPGGDPDNPANMTAAQAQQRVDKLMATDAYFDPNHVDHKDTVAKVEQLMRRT